MTVNGTHPVLYDLPGLYDKTSCLLAARMTKRYDRSIGLLRPTIMQMLIQPQITMGNGPDDVPVLRTPGHADSLLRPLGILQARTRRDRLVTVPHRRIPVDMLVRLPRMQM